MYQVQRFNKYRNESSFYDSPYNGPFWYASKLEASCARELDLRLKAKSGDPLKITKWERQIRVPLEVNGFKICTYIVDFRYWKEDGTLIWQEAKGMETDIFKIKRKLFEAVYLTAHPKEEYEIVKR